MVCFHLAPKLLWARLQQRRRHQGIEAQELQQQPDSPPANACAAAAAAEAGHSPAPARKLAAARSTVRAPVPLVRGLSRRMERWEAGRPGVRRTLALAAISVSFMGCCSLQILAPGFVDVSIGKGLVAS